MYERLSKGDWVNEFPSPIGELHFSILCYYISTKHQRVSVPYRGATFLNKGGEIVDLPHGVSVPYRGATFLNLVYDMNIFTR